VNEINTQWRDIGKSQIVKNTYLKSERMPNIDEIFNATKNEEVILAFK
jgi:hypothetical protein